MEADEDILSCDISTGEFRLQFILEFILKLKIKRNDWLLADTHHLSSPSR